jgi:hypothetical protein
VWVLLVLLYLPASEAKESPLGVLEQYDFTQPQVRYAYPRFLREPSGLACLDTGRALTHDDNSSALYLVDYLEGSPPQPFGTSVPAIKGDFEGVAILDGYVYLLASHGTLLRVPLVTRAGTALARLTTGVERRCNFEGLTARPARRELILACKYIHAEATVDEVHLYRFDIERGAADAQPIVVEVAAVRRKHRLRRIRPSGIEWDPQTRHFLLLAGKENLLLEMDGSYVIQGDVRLSKRFHRQAEGIALDEQGRLILTDEADGRRATLTVYEANASST